MRVSILAILFSFSGVLMAGTGNGQDLDKILVSVNFKNASLKNAIHKIERLAKVPFTYKTSDIARYNIVNYKADDISVAKLLDEILRSTDLGYVLVNSNIIIKKIKEPAESSALLPANSELRDGSIKGRITDQKGIALANASIQLIGTNKGTVANANGEFAIAGIRPGAYRLLVTAIGFDQQMAEITIKDNEEAVFNFQLKEKDNSLEEVVVTALGISRKQRSLGYATQEIKGENLTLTKEQNVIGSLAGKVAGVQVTGSSGASMGGTQKIKIRGVNSIGGGDQPLIVVDGTPISNANFAGSDKADYGNLAQDINPEDVESINVLKGPAASALYGIRGQYGVIMITTKKGKKGPKKVEVQLNSALSIEKAGNFMPLQNLYGGGSSQSWSTLPNGDKYVDMSVDESWGPKMDGTPVRHVFSFYPQDPEYGQLRPFVPQPDNIEDYFETGSNLNNGISVTGGNENTNFRFSFNDTRIEGVEPNTWLRRNNVGLSAGLDLTKKLSLSANINYATNNAQRPAQGSEYGSRYFLQWFQRSVDMKRLKSYKYPDGTFVNWNLRVPSSTTGEVTNFNPLYWNNPYFEVYENLNKDNRNRMFGDVGLSYSPLTGLKLSGHIRADMYTQNIEELTAFGGRRVPAYAVGKYENKELNFEFLAQYSKKWGDISMDANLGANKYDRRYTYLSQATAGGLSAPGYYNIGASIDRPVTSSYLLRKQIMSYYGMVSLGYKNTYFIDASLRNDKSSALPRNNSSYWYPSFSGSFVFSELLSWSPLSFGKLRLSYAKAGSDLNPYETTPFYDRGTVYDGALTVNTLTVPNNLNNPYIEPSFANSYEAGVELRFFKSRLGVDFTYYEQKNKKQIIRLDLSGTSGYATTSINAGLIENKGFELALTATPVKTQNFTWNSFFNLSKNNSKVVELAPGINSYVYGSTTYSSVTSYLISYVGKPYGSLVGQAYQRDPETGKILLNATNNMPLYTAATHDFGSVLPDFTGGFTNIFQVWKFELAANIDFQYGGQFFSRSKMLAVRTGQDPITVAMNDKGKNVRDPVADGGGVRVDGINVTTKQPVTAYVSAQSYYNSTIGRRVYEEWIFDASYVKLREIKLGYTFDKTKLGRLPFRSVGLALIARNPAMIWQKAPKGLDPSEISTGGQAISWYESGQINSIRSYGFNINIGF